MGRMYFISKERRDRLDHNIALAIKHFMTTREHVVPLKPEYGPSGWTAVALEHFEAPAQISSQFEQHAHQQPVPGVGRQILTGAMMPDGSFYGPAHSPLESLPVQAEQTLSPPADPPQPPLAQPVPPPIEPPQPVAPVQPPQPPALAPQATKTEPSQTTKPQQSPDRVRATIAKAREALSRGVDRTLVIARLRAVGIEAKDL